MRANKKQFSYDSILNEGNPGLKAYGGIPEIPAKLPCNHGPHSFTAGLVAGIPCSLDVIFAPENQAILTLTCEKLKP